MNALLRVIPLVILCLMIVCACVGCGPGQTVWR
jgi:hypothetical protein